MTVRRLSLFAVAAFAVVAAVGVLSQQAAGDKQQREPLLYELRTYTTAPGKLPDLHKRFRDHTMQIFKKHGIKNVIYWTPTDDELQDNTLVYVIAHKDRQAADASWEAFKNDPEWQKVYRESREDGPIVINVERQFLSPTDYSPRK